MCSTAPSTGTTQAEHVLPTGEAIAKPSELERFQAKWIPVRVRKTRQNKKIEPRSDSIGTEKALVLTQEALTETRHEPPS